MKEKLSLLVALGLASMSLATAAMPASAQSAEKTAPAKTKSPPGKSASTPASQNSKGAPADKQAEGKASDSENNKVKEKIVYKPKPNPAVDHNNRGFSLGRQQRFDESIKEHDLAVAAEPDNPIFKMNLINAYIRYGDHLRLKGQHEDAYAQYKKAEEADPNNLAASNRVAALEGRPQKQADASAQGSAASLSDLNTTMIEPLPEAQVETNQSQDDSKPVEDAVKQIESEMDNTMEVSNPSLIPSTATSESSSAETSSDASSDDSTTSSTDRPREAGF